MMSSEYIKTFQKKCRIYFVCKIGTGEQGLHTSKQIFDFKKSPIFCCLPFFTYLKSIAETLLYY